MCYRATVIPSANTSIRALTRAKFIFFAWCAISSLAACGQQTNATAYSNYESLQIHNEFRVQSAEELMNSGQFLSQAALQRHWNRHRIDVMSRRRSVERMVLDGLKRGETSDVDRWLRGYLFPMMSQHDAQSLAHLDERRRRFFQKYIVKSPLGPARTFLIDSLTIPTMQNFLDGNYHPAVKANALVILGDLNQSEGRRGDALPRPHPEVLRYLLNVVGNQNTPGYLKMIALASVKRHADLRGVGTGNEFSPAERDQIATLMLNVCRTPSHSRSGRDSAEDWMQRRAIQILGSLDRSVHDKAIATFLQNVVTDESVSLSARLDAVLAIAHRTAFDSQLSADITPFCYVLGEMAAKSAERGAIAIEQKITNMQINSILLDGQPIENRESSAATNTGPTPGRGPGADGPSGDSESDDARQPADILPEYHIHSVQRLVATVSSNVHFCLRGNEKANITGLAKLSENKAQLLKINLLADEVHDLLELTNHFSVVVHTDRSAPKANAADQLATRLRRAAAAIRAASLDLRE